MNIIKKNMECQVQSMATAAANLSEDVNIPEGKVESVCRQWLVREDGVLAYKLQSEEIQHHYGHNKERSQLLRSDFQEARTAQRSEEKEAIAMHMEYERILKEQEDQDAYLAQQLQEKIMKEEHEHQRRIEEEDQRMALELQRKERLRLQRKREEREMRQAEKARAELSGASNSSSVRSMEEVRDAASTTLGHDFSLLSLEPPEDLSPEQFQEFVHRRDAELAKLLQEQEPKTQSENKDDRQIAIEAQDRELAKVLQEQERAKARKARERARQKAAVAQQQEHTQTPSEDFQDRDHCLKERLRSPEWGSGDRRHFASDFSGDPVTNIAAAIDPTFQAGPSTSILGPYPSYVGPPPRTSPPHTPLSPPPTEAPPYTPKEEFFTQGEENGAAPPYMPIQGTRRPSSLEKAKKNRKAKEGCKTQ